jgi:hypothetical protein
MYILKNKIGIFSILFSLLGSYIYLNMSNNHIRDRNEFALNEKSTTRAEIFDGVPISGNKFNEIQIIIKNLKNIDCKNKSVLWVGNSQQHTINNYSQGDHLSIYWLAKKLQLNGFKQGCVIGISLPNINPQEVLYLLRYLENKGVIFSNLIYPLEFMGYRASEIRSDVENAFKLDNTTKKTKQLNTSRVELIEKSASLENIITPAWLKTTDALLDKRLSEYLSFWDNRLDIQSTFRMNLRLIRNKIFLISSSTKRSSIPSRMHKNMAALSSTIDFLSEKNINTFFYFVPIRPNKTFPYMVNDYSFWKSGLTKIVGGSKFSLSDLSNLVEEEYWGSNFANDIDFMHFGSQGHIILADKIFKELMSLSSTQN